MSHFKKILEIEKKYEHIVNNAQKHYETELEKFKDELQLKEDASKTDYIKELKREFEKESQLAKQKGEKILKKAKDEAKHIYENANKKDAKIFLMEELQNV